MTDAKELLWLDDRGQIVAVMIQAAMVVPGPSLVSLSEYPAYAVMREPDRLVVQVRHGGHAWARGTSLWVLDDKGTVTQVLPIDSEYFPALRSSQFTLVLHNDPDPVPAAIVQYVNAAFPPFNTTEKDEDTSC